MGNCKTYSQGFTIMALQLFLCHTIFLSGCNKALGLESGEISDGQITASSSYDSKLLAPFARLNLKRASITKGAWIAGSNNVNQWLQVDLSLQYNVTRVPTQGRRVFRQWVTGYNLLYSDDGVNFFYYENEEGKTKVS